MYFTLNGISNRFAHEDDHNHIPGFYINKYHGKYDILNQYTINDVVQLILSFIVKRLNVGDLVDVLNTANYWHTAHITDIKNNKIFIHYLCWPSKWDEWTFISSDRIRLSGQMTPVIISHHNNPNLNNVMKQYHSLKEIKQNYSEIFIIHIQQNKPEKQIYITTHSCNFLDNMVINHGPFINYAVIGYYICHYNYIIKIDK